MKEMLTVAQEHDAKINMGRVQVGKNTIFIAGAGSQEPPTMPDKDAKLTITDENEDPFSGNINNRKVAERIATSGRRVYTNAARPAHQGDPIKAAADIAKSKLLNPDPVVDNSDDEPETITVKPTAGSPAAVKKVESTAAPATNAPPVWKPNA